MSDGLSIGWSQDLARRRRVLYQRVLGFNMLLHLGIGLMCMFTPHLVARIFDLPPAVPHGWINGWGATLILVTALYIPGQRDPVRQRYPNFAGILGRLWMATVWFVVGGGFFWFGVFDLSFAIILFLLYLRMIKAELQTRP